MKITYAEYQEFWKALDAVPGHKDMWYEEGVGWWPDNPRSTDTLDVKSGFLEWQGDRDSYQDHPLIKGEGNWLASFRAWKKSLTVSNLLVQVPKEDAERFTSLMKENGWKILA